MTGRGKRGKPKNGFPLFPPPLEIPQKAAGFPHSHSYGGGEADLKASPKKQPPKVGQIKPPNWAKRSCQKQEIGANVLQIVTRSST
jgi:hypothetical protein